MKKLLLYSLLFFIFTTVLESCSPGKNAPLVNERKNILIIVSDSLRYDALEANGGRAKTPNINYLVENGSSFSKAYTTSPRTMPASIGILTGKNPAQYPYIDKKDGIRGHYVVPNTEYLLAEFLKDYGYDTLAYLTNPNSYLSNNAQGFTIVSQKERIDSQQMEHIKTIIESPNEDLPYHKIYQFMDYILNLSPKKNFYSLLWIIDPHVPYAPPKKFEAQISSNPDKLKKDTGDYAWAKTYLEYSEYEKNYTRSLYEKEIESVDERIGYIIDSLKKKNLLDKTLIIFTSDHGEHFGEHGVVGHGNSYYEELLHVPLIMSGPGIPKGKNISQQVSLANLSATLYDLLEINEQGYSPAGDSFKKLLAGSSIKETPLFFSGTRPQDKKYLDAVLIGNYKLVTLHDKTNLLFDISELPLEQNNLIKTQIDQYKKLAKHLETFRNENKSAREKNQRQTNSTTKSSIDEKETVRQLKSLGYLK